MTSEEVLRTLLEDPSNEEYIRKNISKVKFETIYDIKLLWNLLKSKVFEKVGEWESYGFFRQINGIIAKENEKHVMMTPILKFVVENEVTDLALIRFWDWYEGKKEL